MMAKIRLILAMIGAVCWLVWMPLYLLAGDGLPVIYHYIAGAGLILTISMAVLDTHYSNDTGW